jgi:hypothetical protein
MVDRPVVRAECSCVVEEPRDNIIGEKESSEWDLQIQAAVTAVASS